MAKRIKKKVTAPRPAVAARLPGLPADGRVKMAEILTTMAVEVLKPGLTSPSREARGMGLLVAVAAWNRELGEALSLRRLPAALAAIAPLGSSAWAELRSDDLEALIAKLVRHKRQHHPNDHRLVNSAEITDIGTVLVNWHDLDPVASTRTEAPTPAAPPRPRAAGTPIADKVLRGMKRYLAQKVIDLRAFAVGRQNARELQKTLASEETLRGLDPPHAIYVYAQNQAAVMAEQLLMLKELARVRRMLIMAEDEYMPNGPPISPLTKSFFGFWSLFDVRVGPGEETVGTIILAVGATFGMHPELLRLIEALQASRMGVYQHEGLVGDQVVLRELVTDEVVLATSPAGYLGCKGELWYVRLVPPPVDVGPHIVLTTPYILSSPRVESWRAYFGRALASAPQAERTAAYVDHMKYGPTHDYWTEFVFEAYLNHQVDAIFLTGLPDVAESRPHSRINQR